MGKSEQPIRMEILLGATAVTSVKSHEGQICHHLVVRHVFMVPKKRNMYYHLYENLLWGYMCIALSHPNGDVLTPDASSGNVVVVMEKAACW